MQYSELGLDKPQAIESATKSLKGWETEFKRKLEYWEIDRISQACILPERLEATRRFIKRWPKGKILPTPCQFEQASFIQLCVEGEIKYEKGHFLKLTPKELL